MVILCGGMGMRLAGETEFKPKPMVRVGPHPMLWHIMKVYGAYGCRRFILCLGYKMEVIKDWVLNYRFMDSDFTMQFGPDAHPVIHDGNNREDWEITCADTGLETMTGGRIHRVSRYIDAEHFFVTYGDGLADLDIADLYEFHRRENRVGTVTGVRPDSRFGVIESRTGTQVDHFREKPQLDSYVSGGFFVFRRDFFSYLDAHCVLEQKPLTRLAAENQLSLYQHQGFWKSMDTYRDFVEYNDMWKRGETPWKVW
ncbi:MAG: sugar phosphate nucleotidyltransferase [Synechococcaceae cyanobacterium]|nr:sugar phosphate nucleotidyltransferase [Synechococcaceae cyanobacterium]